MEASTVIRITDIQPTVFLRRVSGVLEQRFRLALHNAGEATGAGLRLGIGGDRREVALGVVPAGESWHDLFIPEPATPTELTLQMLASAGAGERRAVTVTPPRHWTVHVVQLSHHDLGYTSLPSRVLDEHVSWLDAAIDMASDTRRYPVDARFRMVIEQAWSVEHALRCLPARRAARLVELMR